LVIPDERRKPAPDEPIRFKQAISLGKRGGDRRSERARKDQVGNANLISAKGTTRAYILARLDRDGETGLAAKVRAKEISANAAAERMGWRKKMTPFEHALAAVRKLSDDEWERLQRGEWARRQKEPRR
jgi:hypothetical protein